MNVPTVNVMMTDNALVMKQYFQGDQFPATKALALRDLGKDKDAFLFSPGKEAGLISLEHSLHLNKDGKTPMSVVLTFIDPEKEFENRFLKPAFNMLPSTNIKVETNLKNKLDVVTVVNRLGKRQVKKPSDIFAPLNLTSSSVADSSRPLNSRTVWVAYGIGSDLTQWTTIAATIFNMQVNEDNGSRVITLILLPILTRYTAEQLLASLPNSGETPPIIQNEQAPTWVTGQSKEISTYIENGSKLNLERLFRDTITDYLGKVYDTKNVITLYPDLNKLMNLSFNHRLNARAGKTKGFQDAGLDLTFPLSRGINEFKTGEQQREVKKLIAKSDEFLSQFGMKIINTSLKKAFTEAIVDGKKKETDNDLAKALASTVTKNERELAKELKRIRLLKKNPNLKNPLEGMNLSRIKDNTPTTRMGGAGKTLGSLVYEKNFPFVGVCQTVARMRKGSNITNKEVQKQLDAFQNGIQRNSIDFFDRFVLLVETDTRFLALFQRHLNIGNGVEPVVIFGTERMIDEYLYRKNDLIQPLSPTGTSPVFTTKSEELIGFEITPAEIATAKQLAERQGESFESFFAKFKSQIRGTRKVDSKKLEKLAKSLWATTGDELFLPPTKLKEALLNLTYQKDMREIVKLVTNTKRDRQVVDVNILENALEEIAADQQFPIFRGNVRNSNITSFTVDANQYYRTSFEEGYARSLQLQSISSLKKRNIDFSTLYPNKKEIFNIIHRYHVGEKREVIDAAIRKEFGADFSERGLETFYKFALQYYLSSLQNVGYVGQVSPSNSQSLLSTQQATFDNLSRFNLIVNLETIPMFHVNKTKDLLSPAIIIMDDLQVEGVIRKKVQFNRDSLFSGLYKISGFRHSISAYEVKSEFTLFKDVKALGITRPFIFEFDDTLSDKDQSEINSLPLEDIMESVPTPDVFRGRFGGRSKQ